MKFEEAVSDIRKMVGRKICSIRAGADITLTELDLSENRLELIDSSKNRRSRSLSELRRVWEQLCTNKAVHVDSVLAGSGSSRNQPETILANLPYVEWLMLGGRKHISLVGKPTHQLGTLKQMDSLAAHALRATLPSAKAIIPVIIIVADNPRLIANCIESLSGLPPTAINPGTYKHNLSDREILIVNTSSLSQPIPSGVYVTIPSKTPPLGTSAIALAGEKYNLIVRDGINLLAHIS